MSRETIVEVELLKAYAVALITLLITVVPAGIILLVTKPETLVIAVAVVLSVLAWTALMSVGLWKFCFKEKRKEDEE
jgi:hypothetical protein